jgi:hypothetical protein
MSYQHKEAFSLMTYACSCGHRERFWNGRDGVTPFSCACPSCGDPVSLIHTQWQRDRCVPNHKPHRGQRVWVGMTKERAMAIASDRVQAYGKPVTKVQFEGLVDSIFHDGEAPDLIVTGEGK